MTERFKASAKLVVISESRNGRRRYDKASKRTLVEACLQPNVSIAAMALANGVNANLLRKWIEHYRGNLKYGITPSDAKHPVKSSNAFIPVVAMKRQVELGAFQLEAELPNGVKIKFGSHGHHEMTMFLQTLCTLPCSD
jgi:transposase